MNESNVTNTDDFVSWFSDDPDDWNSFSDYEQRIRNLVQEYNEMAADANEPPLPILGDDPLYIIVRLSELNVSRQTNHELRERLQTIRSVARQRMQSSHPDEDCLDEDCHEDGIGCEQDGLESDENVAEANRIVLRKCHEVGLLEELMTAEQIRFLTMNEFKYWWDSTQKRWRERIQPTKEQAQDYVRCVKMLRAYYSNEYPKGMKRITSEESKELEKKVSYYRGLHLDMRDVPLQGPHGKQGLQRVTGEVLVPVGEWWYVAESYDYIEDIQESNGSNWCVPVRKGNKYALCEMDGQGTLLTEFIYDWMFRYFGGYKSDFVVEQNGKKGLISQYGGTVIPCEMDEIYEMIDLDGIVPFRRGDKWGMAFGTVCTQPVFDELYISSEEYARGRIGEDWFWVDSKGNPTANREERFFGSWYDMCK